MEKEEKYKDNVLINNHDLKSPIFLTGPGGSGKTHTIIEYYKWFNENIARDGVKGEILIVTPTGIAATHLPKAQTIHSAFKFNTRTTKDTILADSQFKNFVGKHRRKVLSKLKVLIIDEISMVSLSLLKMIEYTMRISVPKKSFRGEQWGGVKIIFSGDFSQLPPIVKATTAGINVDGPEFLFETKEWNDQNIKTILLTKNWRQESKSLYNMLNFIRYDGLGMNSEYELIKDDKYDIKMHAIAKHFDDNIGHYMNNRESEEFKDYIILYGTNMKVDALNKERLDKLDGKEETFKYNFESTQFIKPQPFVVEAFMNERNIPQELKLKVGCRVMGTVNKKGFKNGSLGTVISINDFNSVSVKWDSGYISEDIITHGFQQLNAVGDVDFTVYQIPLRLAYAITVHKSQGFSFEKVYIDAGNLWEYNHLYVAMSRAKTLENLYISGFTEDSVRASKKVVKYYLELERQQKKEQELEGDKEDGEHDSIPTN